jgi:uncharacterized membrane protein (DUF2068 family)
MQAAVSMDRPNPPSPPHFEPLRWIGAYKLLKGVLAILGGLLVLRLMHLDLPEIVTHWMSRLSIRPHSALGEFILRKVIAIQGRRLAVLAVMLFAYTPIAFAEGIGLLMRRTWAEWLTVVTTAGMVPLELYELARRFTWVRAAILVLNILVVVYLIWRIRRDRQKHRSLNELEYQNRPPEWEQPSDPKTHDTPQRH